MHRITSPIILHAHVIKFYVSGCFCINMIRLIIKWGIVIWYAEWNYMDENGVVCTEAHHHFSVTFFLSSREYIWVRHQEIITTKSYTLYENLLKDIISEKNKNYTQGYTFREYEPMKRILINSFFLRLIFLEFFFWTEKSKLPLIVRSTEYSFEQVNDLVNVLMFECARSLHSICGCGTNEEY